MIRQNTKDLSYDTLEFNEFLKMYGNQCIGVVTINMLVDAFRSYGNIVTYSMSLPYWINHLCICMEFASAKLYSLRGSRLQLCMNS